MSAEIEIIARIFIIFCFVMLFYVLAKPQLDNVAWSILMAVAMCIVVSVVFDQPSTIYTTVVPWRTIIYLIAMNIIIIVIEQQKVFQYFAIRIIHLTKSNPRYFFYFICTLAAIFSGIMEDVSVVIIFIPLVIRATKILKIHYYPYILGISFSISIGNLLTQYASPVNILLSDQFGLNVSWFFSLFGAFFILIMGMMLFLLDKKMVKQIPPPTEYLRQVLTEIMDPKLLIVNQKKFIRTVFYLVIIFIMLFLSDDLNIPSYLVALIGAILIMLTEKEKISKYLALIDWKLIFFLMAVFLMIACLTLSGMIEMLNDWIVNSLTTNIFVAIIVILIISALISNFAAKSLSIMIFKATFDMLFLDAFVSEGAHTILLGALIIGVNLGGIIFPQASSHIMKTLSLASENNLKDINYNQMIKMSSIFAIIALITGFIYLSLYYLLFFQ